MSQSWIDTHGMRRIGKRLDEIDNPFERGVCEALYHTPEQRRQRRLITAALVFKHSLRGLLFSWPLYLIGLASFAMPGDYGWVLAIFFLPALWVSGIILVKGIGEEYRRYVKGVVLKPQAFRAIFIGRGEEGSAD